MISDSCNKADTYELLNDKLYDIKKECDNYLFG